MRHRAGDRQLRGGVPARDESRTRSGAALARGPGGLAVAGVIALAFWRISSGVATVGHFMGFVGALLLAAQSVGASALFGCTPEGLAAVERIYELLDERPTSSIGRRAAACRLTGRDRVRKVGFAYARRHQPAVQQLLARGARRQTVALVGRSGAGKSTVINLVRAPVRRRCRAHPDRRPGRARRDAGEPARCHRHRQPGGDAVRRHDPRQYRAGPSRAGETEIVAAAKAAAAHEFISPSPAATRP